MVAAPRGVIVEYLAMKRDSLNIRWEVWKLSSEMISTFPWRDRTHTRKKD